MLRITDRADRDLLYGPTNEELITQIFRDNVRSYKQLPCNLYHIQWKFRDEIRPRFGVMRGREFLMKDAYSFDIDEASARVAYQKMFVAYSHFARLGLRALPMAADTGPIGGDLSHEFIILADTGESEVFCHADLLERPAPKLIIPLIGRCIAPFTSLYARTDEKHEPEIFEAEVPADKQVTARGIELDTFSTSGRNIRSPCSARYRCRWQGSRRLWRIYGIGFRGSSAALSKPAMMRTVLSGHGRLRRSRSVLSI